MEDIMQFLIVAGIIAFGVRKQFSKEKKRNAESTMPMPNQADHPDIFPPVDLIKSQPKRKAKKTLPEEGARLTHTSIGTQITPPKAEEESPQLDSEFSIHSTEEAKRAIIWSEILQRKY